MSGVGKLRAYGWYVVAKLEEKQPETILLPSHVRVALHRARVCSVGDEVKGLNDGDLVVLSDIAFSEDGYVIATKHQVVAVEVEEGR